MSTVQHRAFAMIAALALVVGCAMAAVCTHQQAYAANTTLTAGTAFNTATNLAIANSSLSASNKTEFNSAIDNNFYKFTTSARAESTYKLTVRSYNGEVIYLTVYDATHHRIANMKTKAGATGNRNWIFRNLKPKAVYYIEAWRFITDVDDYVLSGVINGNGDEEGKSEFIHVPYKITLKERLTKPSITSFKAWSIYDDSQKHNHWLKLNWSGKSSYNTEKVQIKFWWYDSSGNKQTFYRYTSDDSYSTWTVHWGKSYPYRIQIRPYMTVNGKRIYGKWAKAYIKNKSGEWVKTTEKNKKIAKVIIKAS